MPNTLNALAFCGHLLDTVRGNEDFEWLEGHLAKLRSHLQDPLRLAVVGRIKAGKSTLMNALLGEEVAPTGTRELTFTVNEFRHGAKRSCTVRRRGQVSLEWPIEDLFRATARDASRMEELRQIEYVEVSHPADLLRRLILLDTPGLGSVYEQDEQNTLKALSIDPATIEQRTLSATGTADALLYLFKYAPGGDEMGHVRRFRRANESRHNAFHSIAVMSHVDQRFKFPSLINPLESARNSVSLMMRQHRELKEAFLTILPVAAHMGLGAQLMSIEEFEQIREIAKVDSKMLAENVWRGTAEAFENRAFDINGMPSADVRAGLLRRLTFYGVYAAVETVRAGGSISDVRSELSRLSGIDELRRILFSHFTSRATAITMIAGLDEASHLCMRRRGHGTRQMSHLLNQIEEKMSSFRADSAALVELDLLRLLYSEVVELSDQEFDLITKIAGEHGTEPCERLGVPPSTTRAEMAETSKKHFAYFHARTCFGSFKAPTRRICEMTCILCVALASTLEEATCA